LTEQTTLTGATISSRRCFPLEDGFGQTPKIAHRTPLLPAAIAGAAVTAPPASAIVRAGSKLRPPSVDRLKPSFVLSSNDQTM
jgi:hypothetical protein